MTIEEQAEKFLAEKDINDFVVWRNDNLEGWDLGILLEEFARQVAKAKLEEAAASSQMLLLGEHNDVMEVVSEYNLPNSQRLVVDYQSIVKTINK